MYVFFDVFWPTKCVDSTVKYVHNYPNHLISVLLAIIILVIIDSLLCLLTLLCIYVYGSGIDVVTPLRCRAILDRWSGPNPLHEIADHLPLIKSKKR